MLFHFKDLNKFAAQFNLWVSENRSFIFIINYKLTQAYLIENEYAAEENIFYAIDNESNFPFANYPSQNIALKKYPVDFDLYKAKFDQIQRHLQRGDSFLVNLTQPTAIETNLSLQQIFEFSRSKYQLYFKDEFVTFSPEIFIKIEEGVISSHPMKGTINAELINAAETILADKKELAEHATIVDLIRNDMSLVASKVWVQRFRYIDKIITQNNELLQVSSEIKGILPTNWKDNLAETVLKLLPAGSICGAPKPQTLAIIEETEDYDRGFYTGVLGMYKNNTLNSGVMIRFIEKADGKLIFKSGGGITTRSTAEAEYQEMVDKVYIASK